MTIAYQRSLAALCLLWLLIAPIMRAADDIPLPELGDSSSALFSPSDEYALGQAWLRALRGSVPLFEDPLSFEYLENFLYHLASHSKLAKRELDLVLIDNRTLNAFAVPGGVVGVHTGLIDQAESSAQLASVLSHELAHLSQRHFARGVEASRRTNFATLAGVLAGVVLAASGNADAATAAIATSQAAAIDSQLRYSRLHEREADRIGMQTMVAAGIPASAAANMFRQMQAASRLYGEGVPEFLRTHPVTESRIADAENRARGIAQASDEPDIDYQLMRARIKVLQSENIADAVRHFRHELETDNRERAKADAIPEDLSRSEVARYGLAMALYRGGEANKARAMLAPLLGEIPGRIAYTLLDIEIDVALSMNKQAEQRLRDLYAITPNNYAISMQLAKTLMHNKNFGGAESVLKALSEVRPKQLDVWYMLAEVQGLAGNIIELHLSRAEFFILRGNLMQAQTQLAYALRIAGNDVQDSARIKQRLRDLQRIHQITERL